MSIDRSGVGTPPQLVTLGESLGLVSGFGAGGLEYGSLGEIGIGGSEANVAICASRQGASVGWIGQVGDDVFGRRIVRTLRGEGVHAHPIIDSERPTAVMLKEIVSQGRTRVTYVRNDSAGSRIRPESVPISMVESARILHVTGITLGVSVSAAASVITAVEAARAAGVLVSFDINHRHRIWDRATASSAYRNMIALADIVFAGQDEAEMVVDPGAPEDVLRALAGMGPAQVILKLGSRGALALVEEELRGQAARRVVAVDTVGAGDAFVGAYLASVLRGDCLRERLEVATASGTLACTRSGDWEAAPTLDEIALLSSDGDPVER